MKTKDICKELTLTRQGLYFMLKKHKKALGSHVYKNNNGRWEVDNEGFAILKEEREKTKRSLCSRHPMKQSPARFMAWKSKSMTWKMKYVH